MKTLIHFLNAFTREDVRRYIDKAVSQELENIILRARQLHGTEANSWASQMYHYIVDRKMTRDQALSRHGKIVFVSLPITDYDLNERLTYAAKVKQRLALTSGVIKVITPFDMPDFRKNQPWDWYMVRTLAMMQDCTTIFLCEGWQDSRGCQMEKKEAERRKMEVWEDKVKAPSPDLSPKGEE